MGGSISGYNTLKKMLGNIPNGKFLTLNTNSKTPSMMAWDHAGLDKVGLTKKTGKSLYIVAKGGSYVLYDGSQDKDLEKALKAIPGTTKFTKGQFNDTFLGEFEV